MYENSTIPCVTGVDRRRGGDRRERTFLTFLRALNGQRSLGRRNTDQISFYPDQYEAKFLVVCVSIVVLSCFDSLFTLNMMQLGVVQEANPLMRWAIEEGSLFFFWLKLIITTLGITVLLIFKEGYLLGRFKVAHVLYSVLGIYVLLTKYHLWIHYMA